MKKIFLLLIGVFLLGAGCSSASFLSDDKQTIDQQKRIDELTKKVEELTATKTIDTSVLPKIIREVPKKELNLEPSIVTKPVEQIDSTQKIQSLPEKTEIPPVPSIVEPLIGENVTGLLPLPPSFISLQDKKTEYERQVANLNTIFDLSTYGGMSAWGKEIDKLKAEHSLYIYRYENCKKLHGQHMLADVGTGLCYCQNGYVKDNLTYQCVPYEQFCRNKYFENGFSKSDVNKQWWCLYCPTGYKLSAEFVCYK